MGSVKRLRDKVYRIVYDIPSTDGTRKQKRETLYNVTKSEAEETLAKRKEARSSPDSSNPNITIADLFEEFFQVKEDNVCVGFRALRGNFQELHRAGDR